MNQNDRLLQSIHAISICDDLDELQALIDDGKAAYHAHEITLDEYYALCDVYALVNKMLNNHLSPLNRRTGRR